MRATLLVVALGLLLGSSACHSPDSNGNDEAFSARMGTTTRVAVFVDSKNLIEAVAKLQKIPKDVVFRVEHGEAAAIRFFKRHTPLYLTVKDLESVYRFMKESYQYKKDLFNPLGFFTGKKLKKPEIDFDGMADRYLQVRPYKNLPSGRKVIYVYGNVPTEMRSRVNEVLNGLKPTIEEVKEIAVLAENRDQARKVAAKIRSAQIGTVQTIEDFIPDSQPEKIVVLKRIRRLLTPKVLSFLSAEDRAYAEGFLNLEIFEPFFEKDLPQAVLARFTEVNGAVGNVIYVDGPRDQIEKIAQQISPQIRIAPFLTNG
jgi:hypothetical protein